MVNWIHSLSQEVLEEYFWQRFDDFKEEALIKSAQNCPNPKSAEIAEIVIVLLNWRNLPLDP